jgi:hypothetical protein
MTKIGCPSGRCTMTFNNGAPPNGSMGRAETTRCECGLGFTTGLVNRSSRDDSYVRVWISPETPQPKHIRERLSQ